MALSKHTRTRLIWHNGKKQRAHRVIMEKYLGRPLRVDEDVHHINHNPLDNRIENLSLMPKILHQQIHSAEKQIYPDIKICIECGGEFTPNPRKRARQKCCSHICAQKVRVKAALKVRNRATGGLSDIQGNRPVRIRQDGGKLLNHLTNNEP